MRLRIVLAFLAIAPLAAAAQQLADSAPWLNLHFTHASGSTVDASIPNQDIPTSTSSSNGGGFTVGYGFLPWLAAYVTVDNGGSQTLTSTVYPMTGTQTLYQQDAGLRFQLPLGDSKIKPYAVLAASARMLSGPVVTESATGAFSEWGHAVTYGIGVNWAFAKQFGLDVSYLRSTGAYSTLQQPPIEGQAPTFATNAPSTSTSRVLAGVNWYLSPLANSAAAVTPNKSRPVDVGQALILHAGTTTLKGKVISFAHDTLIMQTMVKDQAVQMSVPVACIVSMERQTDPKPMNVALRKGALLGSIIGGLAGIFVNTRTTRVPAKSTSFALTYVVGGAAVGTGVGAAVSLLANRWESVPLPKSSPVQFDDREALCRQWNQGN